MDHSGKYLVQKCKMLWKWKQRLGNKATYTAISRNVSPLLAINFLSIMWTSFFTRVCFEGLSSIPLVIVCAGMLNYLYANIFTRLGPLINQCLLFLNLQLHPTSFHFF